MSKPLAIVLAAGKGTRMKSDLPKVLFRANGRPMVDYVLDAVEAAGIQRILVVVGFRAELVQETLRHRKGVEFVRQTRQLGTGDAVKACRGKLLDHSGPVLVLAGDSPLTQSDSLRVLLEYFEREAPSCLLGTVVTDETAGLGRIIRDADGDFARIVEEKDATDQQRKIREVNVSTYVFSCRELLETLALLQAENKQREYYLTDCPGILKSQGKRVVASPNLKPCEALSVNTLDELARVEAELQRLAATRRSRAESGCQATRPS